MSDTLFKRVTRDSFIALFWQVAGGACLFIFHTLLTRHLNMDDYGRVSYVISIVAFLGMMAPLGLSQTSMRFASVYFETSDWKALKGFVHYSIVVSFLAGLAMAIIMFGLAGRFLAIYSDPLRIAVWAIPAIGLTLTLGGILRGLRRIGKATFLITVLAQGILAIAIGISVVSKSNLGVSRVVIFYLTAYLGAAGIGLLWMLRGGLSSEYAAARADFSSTKWLTVSLPILVSVMMVQVFQRSD
ncbi:MAG: oligosaccharide flippase family protein, partial [Proteobacteria bacterium]|nr:oligosaccharide flippase family protein [Desulfobulbaceae bacterium]MBU4152011.1 oligosaccharide flippase family protein [Pseudomonadota bacterium]